MCNSVHNGERGRGECVNFKQGTSSVVKQIHGCAAAGTIDCVMSYSYHPADSSTFCVYKGRICLYHRSLEIR